DQYRRRHRRRFRQLRRFGIGWQWNGVLFGGLFLRQFERPQQLRDLLGVGSRTEYLARVFLERSDPAPDIGDVLTWVVADAEVFAEHQRRDFRPQFFPRICFGPERMRDVAIEARRMSGPMPIMPLSA